ncbi:MAG: hypothetical protein AABX49_01860 [Nanoarchaeota archaeon]
MISASQIRITRKRLTSTPRGINGVGSIRYRVNVSNRKDSGFGLLVAAVVDEDFEWILPKIRGLKFDDIFASMIHFCPSSYPSYPNPPNKNDEKKMRKGVGSALLEEMLYDAKNEFNAAAIVGVGASYSMSRFFEKKGFTTIYRGEPDSLGTYYKFL